MVTVKVQVQVGRLYTLSGNYTRQLALTSAVSPGLPQVGEHERRYSASSTQLIYRMWSKLNDLVVHILITRHRESCFNTELKQTVVTVVRTDTATATSQGAVRIAWSTTLPDDLVGPSIPLVSRPVQCLPRGDYG